MAITAVLGITFVVVVFFVTFSMMPAYAQLFENIVTLTEPTEPNSSFGSSVATGDINGDGIEDVIVGAPSASFSGFSAAGKAFVFFGPDYSTKVTLQDPNPLRLLRFGSSVASGDIDGDGIDDVLVGGVGGQGRVNIFFGPDLDPSMTVTLSQPPLATQFGTDVAVGDINNDGLNDIIVGAQHVAVNDFNLAGSTFVFFNSPTGLLLPPTVLTEPIPAKGALFGIAVEVGDLNNDGADDVIVGADDGVIAVGGATVIGSGQAYVFLGGSSSDPIQFDTTSDFTLDPPSLPTDDGRFGIDLAVGDINGDNIDDVIVGAFFRFGGPGKAFVFLGDPAFDTTADFTLTSPSAATGDFFGVVVTVGDLTGDGFDEVIVGAQTPMKIFVFEGPSLTTVTEAPVSVFMDSRGLTTGDTNNGGTDDLIVGSTGPEKVDILETDIGGILRCGDKTIRVGDFCVPDLLAICADGTIADNILFLCNADNTALDAALAALAEAQAQRDAILTTLFEFLRVFGVI